MQLEKQIQAKIIKELQRHGWLVIRPVSISKTGYPDLFCFKNGTTVFVEVKRPGEKPTELQEHRHNELRREGFPVVVATSLNHIDSINSHLKPNL